MSPPPTRDEILSRRRPWKDQAVADMMNKWNSECIKITYEYTTKFHKTFDDDWRKNCCEALRGNSIAFDRALNSVADLEPKLNKVVCDMKTSIAEIKTKHEQMLIDERELDHVTKSANHGTRPEAEISHLRILIEKTLDHDVVQLKSRIEDMKRLVMHYKCYKSWSHPHTFLLLLYRICLGATVPGSEVQLETFIKVFDKWRSGTSENGQKSNGMNFTHEIVWGNYIHEFLCKRIDYYIKCDTENKIQKNNIRKEYLSEHYYHKRLSLLMIPVNYHFLHAHRANDCRVFEKQIIDVDHLGNEAASGKANLDSVSINQWLISATNECLEFFYGLDPLEKEFEGFKDPFRYKSKRNIEKVKKSLADTLRPWIFKGKQQEVGILARNIIYLKRHPHSLSKAESQVELQAELRGYEICLVGLAAITCLKYLFAYWEPNLAIKLGKVDCDWAFLCSSLISQQYLLLLQSQISFQSLKLEKLTEEMTTVDRIYFFRRSVYDEFVDCGKEEVRTVFEELEKTKEDEQPEWIRLLPVRKEFVTSKVPYLYPPSSDLQNAISFIQTIIPL